jgi:hypothetical protein
MLITYFSLIILCFFAVSNVLLAKDYIKKILALSISHASIILLLILVASESSKKSEILVMIVTITALFLLNLVVGWFLIKNIKN